MPKVLCFDCGAYFDVDYYIKNPTKKCLKCIKKCKLHEHIFSVNDDVLMCEKCNIRYSEYLKDVEIHKNDYRFNKK